MINLLRVDFYRMYRKKWLWAAVTAMVFVAVAFCIMQHTAMDYVVALDRVVFLPMTFYGIAMAALAGIFIGDDFDDGVIRNKIIAGRTRASIYLSNLLTCQAAGITVYLLTTTVALGVGINWFEVNVTAAQIVFFTALGTLTCLAYCSIYSMISTLTGNKSHAIAICMALSFFLLFLCLHTNETLVQKEIVDGVSNPHYVQGVKRIVYELLHDINPTGQVAQLSAMSFLNPARFILVDVVLIPVTTAVGIWRFHKKDIK